MSDKVKLVRISATVEFILLQYFTAVLGTFLDFFLYLSLLM